MMYCKLLFFISFIAISTCQECVKYDFEENFSLEFRYSEICEMVMAARWNERLYESTNVNTPHELSTKAITPSSRLSCVSSFSFTMHAGGLLQLNVYMWPLAITDNISVMVYRNVVGGPDRAVGGISTNQLENKYGVNTLEVNFPETIETFEGYLVLTGTTAFGSTVLVDSFRYIPPNMDESSCVIYEEDIEEENGSGDGDEPEGRDEKAIVDALCTTSQFDTYRFEQRGFCKFFPLWTSTNELPLGIEAFRVNSQSYISPGTSPSCISSSDFEMSYDGILEVNFYMAADDDLLHVTVYQIDDNGLHTPVVDAAHTTSTGGNWYTLSIPLLNLQDVSATFKGYVTLFGRAASLNTVLVDSFRFYTPTIEEDCTIYDASVYKDNVEVDDDVSKEYMVMTKNLN